MNREKLRISYPVIVEGKYDKIALSQVIDAPIFCTGGFSIFNRGETRALFRRLAESSPIILLVDSDGGGKQIRSYLTGILPKDRLIQLYIPQIRGKERRKTAAGKAGLLGVEGMEAALLRDLFLPYCSDAAAPKRGRAVTKTDFYVDGLSGGDRSAARRAELALSLGLPADMTANALLAAINLITDVDGYRDALRRLSASSPGAAQDQEATRRPPSEEGPRPHIPAPSENNT